MTVTKWAPLVYARTSMSDFRFMAVPDDFDEEKTRWALKYIRASFPSLAYDGLRGRPRWIVFRDARYCVVGTTCMVDEILDVPTDQFRDKEGRPLYVFLGFVSQSPFPQMLSRKLRSFGELYNQYVKQQFWNKPYSWDRDKLPIGTYEKREWASSSEPKSLLEDKLNTDKGKVGFWPEEDSERLWYSAAWSTEAVSVCLGLSRKSDALTGPLLNAAVHGLSVPCIEDKKVKPSEELPPQPDQPTSSASPRKSRHSDHGTRHMDLWDFVADFLKSLCPCNWSDSQRSLAREMKEGGSGRGHHQRQPQIPAGFRSKPRDSRPGKKIAEPSPALPKPEDDET